MGACCTTRVSPDFFPSYVVKNPQLDLDAKQKVRSSWKALLDGTSAYQHFLRERKSSQGQEGDEQKLDSNASSDDSSESARVIGSTAKDVVETAEGFFSPLSWFYDSFYSRLFSVSSEEGGGQTQ